MNDVYTLEEIVFGLRCEYLKMRQKLDELKKYIVPTENVEDYKFACAQENRIAIYFEMKKNLLEKIREHIRMRVVLLLQ